MIRGLSNVGRDICIYNSVLQVLASTRPLLIHLESISTNSNQLPLHYHLHSLLRYLSTPNLINKYLGVSKSNVEDMLFPYRRLKKIPFLYNARENEALFFYTILSLSN
jgi:hypothetical protein